MEFILDKNKTQLFIESQKMYDLICNQNAIIINDRTMIIYNDDNDVDE
jgi:hypothetical protein